MSANTFGQIFKVTTFGESHGPAYGLIIDGCPAGVEVNLDLLQANLKRRRPGQSSITTARQEMDEPEILSGIYQNKTLGTPICVVVRNQDQKSSDYDVVLAQPRIGHADDTWKIKFGHSDHRGGGRSSGRETLCRVIAGSFAQMLCQKIESQIQVKSYSSQIGEFVLAPEEIKDLWSMNIDQFTTRFPSERDPGIVKFLEMAKQEGESYGGVVETQVRGVPAGLGQPVFHKFKADLGAAMLSLGAVTGFEFGDGFGGVALKGTEFHHTMNSESYGGIRGGITTGDPLLFRVGFKPTSSIKDISKKGRHDPCIVPRAVPVVEAMAWLTIADHLLWSRLDKA
jgi:chorismate synthase